MREQLPGLYFVGLNFTGTESRNDPQLKAFRLKKKTTFETFSLLPIVKVLFFPPDVVTLQVFFCASYTIAFPSPLFCLCKCI